MKQSSGNYIRIRSPKRNSKSDKVKEFYSYYAGYSDMFVEDILNYLQLEKGQIILDPWNGSGTTTYVAWKKGYQAIGFDINPVMPIVACARQVNDHGELKDFYKKIVKQARGYNLDCLLEKDPLKYWMKDESVAIIRKIEKAIQEVFLAENHYQHAFLEEVYREILVNSNLSFYYVNLFRTVNELLSSFRASNPTWVKAPRKETDKLALEEVTIFNSFEKNLNLMIEAIKSEITSEIISKKEIILGVASSKNIPLENSTVDAVITSPPYCTRIDYAITTRIELAILGLGYDAKFENLRSQMIGTIKIVEEKIEINKSWGETALIFLESVRNHNSKASRSYYLKLYLQYFDSVYNSLLEIDRVLRNEGYAVIVVQDSYYKDVHLNLPKVFMEMASSLGWKLIRSEAFYQQQTMAAINKRKKKYRSTSSAIESALIFRKGE